ncbi:MAG TPA: DUF2520 domain-containing protein [Dehalococcoidia bacterium]|nr:DUF2520 domain-containing protein [Dehalococcoidia bacterium]
MAATKKNIGFIGAGRVGGALAISLHEAGYPVVAVASRSPEAAAALADHIPGCQAVTPQEVVDRSEVVFITTPDAAIRPVCESLTWRAGMAAVHTSGSESSALLEKAAREGAATGSLHPLQTFADAREARTNLPASYFAVEAEGWLRLTLLEIVAALQGTAIELRPEDKALYHASATILSNYTVTLAKLASDLWLRFGWERPAALRALLPLLKGAVNNVESLGIPLALTGPIARGDVQTVERHIAALREAAPDVLPVYRELALQTIPVALAAGGLSNPAAEALRMVLEREQPAGSREGARPQT